MLLQNHGNVILSPIRDGLDNQFYVIIMIHASTVANKEAFLQETNTSELRVNLVEMFSFVY